MMKKNLFTVMTIGCMAMMMVAGAGNVSSFTKPANSTVIAEGITLEVTDKDGNTKEYEFTNDNPTIEKACNLQIQQMYV